MSDMAPDPGARAFLEGLFRAAVAAGQAKGHMALFLPAPPRGRTVVVGAGKAAAAMAAEVDALWPAKLSGAVVVPYGYGLSGYQGRIQLLEAGHPVPDQEGCAAARLMLDLVGGLSPDDLVIVLLSGGASALLAALPAGISLDEKRALNKALLRSGATIHEINTVRKHISLVKGGRLAAAAFPAPVVTLAISDVPGDVISDIGSGPTVGDPTTCAEALSLLDRYGITASPAILRHLAEGRGETPKPGDPILAQSVSHIIRRPLDALKAAASYARSAGYDPLVLGDALEGEARGLGAAHAALALKMRAGGQRVCLISGGETTVSVTGSGRGGRNTEYLLGLLCALDGAPGISAVAGDTDGIDGSERNAGAFIFPHSLERARRLHLDAEACLANNDAFSFFERLGDLLVTGPTCTNVNDFRAIIIDPGKAWPVISDV